MTGNQTDLAQDSIHMFRFLKRGDSTRDLTALEDWQCQRADRLKGIKQVTHYVESIKSETSFANVQWDGVEELWSTRAQIVDLEGRFEDDSPLSSEPVDWSRSEHLFTKDYMVLDKATSSFMTKVVALIKRKRVCRSRGVSEVLEGGAMDRSCANCRTWSAISNAVRLMMHTATGSLSGMV
jgi:hypothetical protein